MASPSAPSVYFTLPTTLSPFPETLPNSIRPPIRERSFRAPFGIDATLYNLALEPWVPFLGASAYIIAVFTFNSYNARHKNEPWRISRRQWFRYFVVVHNLLLAAYSFATFAAMCRAIAHTWPGWVREHPAASIADALCKLHGPRGIGDAATYNTSINIWEVKNPLIHLDYNGSPDPTDVGRLWNEGLAFWGWLFYVSKFYEVLDTFIILAKGKRSATLQTYHHAGAMLCMWAGIRYMSPPIWMFVFINSGIHAMMYTYYTLSALGYRVPQALKRTLTSLQIVQFVFGASYAAAHLFIQYDIPVSTPYQVMSTVERVVSSASSAASSMSSAASSFVESPTVTAAMGQIIKKWLLRAAGEEGVAERVGMQQQSPVLGAIQDRFPNPGLSAGKPEAQEQFERFVEKRWETRWRTEWTRVNCIDTSGEAFAIYLNLVYLAPLTWLFARFFMKAYTQRGKSRSISQATRSASDAAREASRETKASVEKAGKRAEDELERRTSQAESKAKETLEEFKRETKTVRESGFSSTSTSRTLSEQVQSYEGTMKDLIDRTKEEIQEMGESSSTSRESAVEDEPASPPVTPGGGLFRMSGPTKYSSSFQFTTTETDDTDEPAETQDENLSASEALRPGPGRFSGDDDTDAMGKSGSIIDLTKEKAGDAKEEVKDTLDG